MDRSQDTSIYLHEDIIYAILDYLQHDRQTLASCSLISHAWVSPSRRYLYHTITVKFQASNALAFIEFLRTCPDARSFLRALTLDGRLGHQPVIRLQENVVRTIIKEAISLRSLVLVDILLSHGSADLPAATGDSSSPSLDRLQIVNATFLNDEQYLALLDVVCACSSIDTLDLSVYIDSETQKLSSPEVYRDAMVFPAVRDLAFQLPSEISLSPLYQKIQRSALSNGSLTSISFCGLRRVIDGPTCGEVYNFCEVIINGARRTLQNLEFHAGENFYWRVDENSPVWDALDLSEHDQLQNLVLALECEDLPYAGEELTWTLRNYAHLFQHHPPPSLKCLTFKIRVPYNRDTLPYLRQYKKYLTTASYRPFWDAMDDALSRLGLGSSPQVVLEYVGPWDGLLQTRGEIEVVTQQLFPITHQKGKLRVAFSTSFPRWGY
ncbi:hypothetical protein C2E23DRAFT_29638 [Lenzites betulinus]|nr:hypothetical protein C2E23DRAFT_29638 [Lenzites betulinus]